MSDEGVAAPNKWAAINSQIAKKDQTVASSGLPAQPPLAGIENKSAEIKKNKLDLIGRFKVGGVERRAAIEQLRALHDTQLEATKHALKRALDVEKSRVDLIAKKYIYEITEEHLRDMRHLGMSNYQARVETLLTLNENTARMLERAQAQDVPPAIREMTLDAIMDQYKDFCSRLSLNETKSE